jgi:hypothetical protein
MDRNTRVERAEADWFHCDVKDGEFHGAGGPADLLEILGTLRGWVEAADAEDTGSGT